MNKTNFKGMILDVALISIGSCALGEIALNGHTAWAVILGMVMGGGAAVFGFVNMNNKEKP